LRPTTIPDEQVAIHPGSVRGVLAAPGGDLTDPNIAAVEVLFDRVHDGAAERVLVRLALEDGDLERLAAGGNVWLAFYGPIPVFSLDVKAPGE
jgi:hypothetical protein